MGRHLWLMHSLLPLVIGLSTPPKPLPLAERPQAAEQIVTPNSMLAAAASLEESVAALPVEGAPAFGLARWRPAFVPPAPRQSRNGDCFAALLCWCT